VIERFSLDEAFFDGNPLWRTARMFEQDPAGANEIEKTGTYDPVFQTPVRAQIEERVPRTQRKNAEATA
jgi:hypothetical protein